MPADKNGPGQDFDTTPDTADRQLAHRALYGRKSWLFGENFMLMPRLAS